MVEPTELDLKCDPESTAWVEVSGKNGKTIREDEDLNYNNWLSDEQLDKEVTYAIEFTPWNEWCGMQIDPDALKTFTPVDIVVHSLWEMTYISHNEMDIENTQNELKGIVDKIDSGEIKCIPSEEVFRQIKNKLKIEDGDDE